MSKLKEQIIKSIDLQNGTFIDKDSTVQPYQPRNAYLLPKEDGTHERWVTDDNGVISKQTGSGSSLDQDNIPKVVTLTLEDLGMTSSNTGEEINQALANYINGLNLTIGEKELYFFQVDGFPDISSGGGNSTQLIEVTKAELDTHILNSTLTPGALYKITGVQPFLYGGTDIYLKAISTNALEEKGMGKFYVPKYDKNVARYGIFDGYVNVSVTDSSYHDGSIPYEASVTTNNGATGKFKSVNLIEYVSGDWGTVTEMYINGITFNVTSATTSIYSVNDTAIFGGKVWKNITGNHGNIVDIFTLSNDWEVIAYNEADYNIEFDEIGYDVENDCITYRRDKSNNIVEFSYNWWFFLENDYMNEDMENSFCNPIKSFQWGNHFDYSAYKGVMGNSIYNSIFECINSTLELIYSNTLNNGQINSNTLENSGQINSNTLNNGYIYSNTLNNGQINSNTLENNGYIYSNTLENSGYISSNTLENSGYISSNTLNNGYIYSNTLNNGQINSNTLENSGQINSNTLENSGYINSNTLNTGYINSNTLNNGQIYSNTLNNGQINSNTLENSGDISSNTLNNGYIYSNTLNNGQINSNTLENSGQIYSNTLNTGQIRLGLLNPINNKTIQHLTINSGDIGGNTGIDLSTATLVYADYERIVFKNSAGITKIRYIDGSGNTVIANLTD